MSIKSICTLSLVLFGAQLNAQDCPQFNAENTGKPVKVTFYTEANACFTMTQNGAVLNETDSKRVVFYMDYGTVKTKVKLSNGTELEKSVMAGNTLAAITMEITYNEKKDSWDIKNRLGQGEVTAETKAQWDADADAMNAKMEADKAARDKEWDDKRAAEQAAREAEKANEQPKYTIQKVDTHVDTDIQQVDTKLSSTSSSNSSSSSSSSNASAGSGNANDGKTVTKGSNMYEVQVMCNGNGVANTYVSLAVKDFIYGTCLTDESGYCKLYTNEVISCSYPIDIKGAKSAGAGGDNASANASSTWSIEGFYYLNCDKGTLFKLDEAAKGMGEMMGIPASQILSGWGF
jgi:hypothetical protein